MAAWTARLITSTRLEVEVPAAQPFGAALGDIEAAIGYAANRYRAAHDIPENVTVPDDALHFRAADDAILISFTVETPA